MMNKKEVQEMEKVTDDAISDDALDRAFNDVMALLDDDSLDREVEISLIHQWNDNGENEHFFLGCYHTDDIFDALEDGENADILDRENVTLNDDVDVDDIDGTDLDATTTKKAKDEYHKWLSENSDYKK
jgi:hypothetical protein